MCWASSAAKSGWMYCRASFLFFVLPALAVDVGPVRVQKQPAAGQASAFTGPQAGLNGHRVE